MKWPRFEKGVQCQKETNSSHHKPSRLSNNWRPYCLEEGGRTNILATYREHPKLCILTWAIQVYLKICPCLRATRLHTRSPLEFFLKWCTVSMFVRKFTRLVAVPRHSCAGNNLLRQERLGARVRSFRYTVRTAVVQYCCLRCCRSSPCENDGVAGKSPDSSKQLCILVKGSFFCSESTKESPTN